MLTYKDRQLGKKIDSWIVPAEINTKNLCQCLDPCLVYQLLEFALTINRIKNGSNCPSSTQGIQSTQPSDKIYCPTIIKWKTKFECKTGKKLVLSQHEMVALYDYMNTKNSHFGPIIREVLKQEQEKKFARNKVNCPSSTQGLQSSQQGDLQFCVKVYHPTARRIYTTKCRANNCCHYSKKQCGCKSKETKKCILTNCY